MLRPVGPPSGEEPVSLKEAKAQVRVDYDDEDLLLDLCITAAREYAEEKTGRALVDRNWELVLDGFPAGPIEIRRVPLDPESVEIVYIDNGGAEQTIANSDLVVVAGEPARVAPAESWPSTRRGRIGAVVVRFVAGPSTAEGGVPKLLKSAMLLHIGDLFANREETIVGTIVAPRGALAEVYDTLLVGRRYA